MPEPQSNPGADRAQQILVAVIVGMVATVIVAVPAGIGIGLWYSQRRRLARGEYALIAGGGLLALALVGRSTIPAYFRWLVDGKSLIADKDFGWILRLPVLDILPFVAITWGVVGFVMQSKLRDVLMARIGRAPKEDVSVVPTDVEKARIAQPAPDGLLVTPDAHSLDGEAPVGKRPFYIGVDRHGSPAALTETEIGTHAIILGSTGSGKTETIKNVIGNLADLGWNIVLIDLKEDTKEGGLRDFCSVYAREHALRYQELALSSPHPTYWFNPLYGMSYDEAINTLMSLQDFDDGYWQAVNKTMIGQLVTLFYDAHAVDPEKYPAPDMYTMGHLLRQPDLKAATKEMVAKVVSSIPGRSTADFSAFVKPSDDERKSAAGLGSRIINMFESEAGRRTLRPGPGRETMDVTAKGVCYIGLNTLGLSELARVVSTSALLRLSAYAGARTTGAAEIDGSRTAVIIDEANWIDRRQVQNLLSRARSAGISVWLCTQGPQDWSDENGDDWNKIVNNVNVGILMRQGSEEAAVMCADFVGKRKQTSLMSQIRDGELTESGSLREAYEHVVTPDQFRTLRIGEAVVKVNVPEDRLAWVKVALRDPAAKPRTASRRRSHGRP